MPHNYLIATLNQSCVGTSGRNDEHIHASDLERFCAREYALCVKHKFPYHPIRRLSKGESVTFELGNRLHDLVRNRLARQKVLYGKWRCTHCRYLYFGLQPENRCECGVRAWKYVEYMLIFEEAGCTFTGSLDSIVAQTPSISFMNEIKSIKPDDFKALTQPLRDHTYRMSTYLWMLRKADPASLRSIGVSKNYGTVTYISKGHHVKELPWKSFKVVEDEEFIRSLEAKVKELKSFSKTKKLPVCICRDKFASMAKTCKVTTLCFSKEA